jgi:hypothetical protein
MTYRLKCVMRHGMHPGERAITVTEVVANRMSTRPSSFFVSAEDVDARGLHVEVLEKDTYETLVKLPKSLGEMLVPTEHVRAYP